MEKQELAINLVDYVCAHCGRRVVYDSDCWIHDVTLSVFCETDENGKWNVVKPKVVKG